MRNNYIINLQNKQIIKLLLILLIFSIFFPIRLVFFTKEAFLTGDYSDFTSFSLYLSDIFLILIFVYIFPYIYENFSWTKINIGLPIFIIWLILALIFKSSNLSQINLWYCFKFIELIVAYETFMIIFQETALKITFFKLFAWFCAIQSVLALSQFASQSSIGLYKLGEQHLNSAILGVSKIVSGGTTLIRGYGTFPHPNPLSAFLVAGVIITVYLLIQSEKRKSRMLYSLLLFLNILGVTVTFSRAAYLALALGLLILSIGLTVIARREAPKQSQNRLPRSFQSLAMTLTMVTISVIVSFFLFKPFLFSRATFSDQSTIDRKFYNAVGLNMIQKNPIFGVGVGESVLHMEHYSSKTLQPWEKQPPHNYFIIAAAELGIPGALLLIWIIFSHLWGLLKKIKPGIDFKLFTFYFLLFTILATFLLLMQFDHYFYTLEQTQILLWIFLGLIAAEIKNPREGDINS